MSTNETTRPRLRWKRVPRSNYSSPVRYALSRGGPVLAWVQALNAQSWFWYGDGINTADRPATLEECQREAMSRIRSKELCTDGG